MGPLCDPTSAFSKFWVEKNENKLTHKTTKTSVMVSLPNLMTARRAKFFGHCKQVRHRPHHLWVAWPVGWLGTRWSSSPQWGRIITCVQLLSGPCTLYPHAILTEWVPSRGKFWSSFLPPLKTMYIDVNHIFHSPLATWSLNGVGICGVRKQTFNQR